MKADRPRFDVRLLDADDLVEIAEAHRDRIVAAAAKGKSIDGQALGTYKAGPDAGRPITLKRTGNLLGGMKATRGQDAAHLDADVPYARHVFERFDVMQIDEAATTRAVERRFEQKQRKP